MTDRLEAALRYAALGWKIVPLRARGKIPWINEWQAQASDDEEQIAKWFEDRPQSNVGLQLGPRSGVIDIEGDQEGAEEDLLKLFGGDVPVTATWKADRGKHRLFRYRDDLPQQAVIHIGKLEIRIGGGKKGAQSVLPPSIHPKGMAYEWLVSPDECEPAELPDEVVTRIWNHQGGKSVELPEEAAKRTAEDWERITKGVGEGERNESMAAWIGRDLATRANVSSAAAVQAAWDAAVAVNAANRPPIEEGELRATFNSILTRERRKRAIEGAMECSGEGKTSGGGSVRFAGWRLEIVLGEPPSYRLFSPLWDGFLRLTSDEMAAPRRICVKALEQKQCALLPKQFTTLWEGTRGKDGSAGLPSLYQWVVEHHTAIVAPAEAVRSSVVAEALLDFLIDATPLDDDEEPSAKGIAYRLPDGGYLFRYRKVLNGLRYEADRIDREDLNELLSQVGFSYRRVGPSRTRIHWLQPENMAVLREIASRGGDTCGGGAE